MSAKGDTEKPAGNRPSLQVSYTCRYAAEVLYRKALPPARRCRNSAAPLAGPLIPAAPRFIDGHLYACDLADCGRRFLEIDRLATYWLRVLPVEMLIVNYEKLVADVKAESR